HLEPDSTGGSMDPDDPPKTIRIEKWPIDERNALGHGIEKTEVGIKQQDPGEDQRKVRHEIGDPTKRLENFATGHVRARDEPGENHGQYHRVKQAHDEKDKTHPQRAQRARIGKGPNPVVQSVDYSLARRSKVETPGE